MVCFYVPIKRQAAPPPKKESKSRATAVRARHLAHLLINHMNKNETKSPVKMRVNVVFQVLAISYKAYPPSDSRKASLILFKIPSIESPLGMHNFNPK